MKKYLITVTPEIAKEWLGKKTENRKIRIGYVEALSRAIEEGHFLYTGDPIKFDINGNLMDGQHRLSAIVKSNMPLSLEVIEGLPPETYHVIDMGMSRTLADSTGLNNTKLVQIYSVMLDVLRGSSLRKTAFDILALNEDLGVIALALLQHCGTNRKFFGSASIRAAAVIAIKSGQPQDYVFKVYKNLIYFHDDPPLVGVLHRYYNDHPMRLMRQKVGESTTRIRAFVLGMCVFDKSNQERRNLINISNKRENYYLSLCKNIVISSLSIEVPKLSNVTDRKYEQVLKENIKLKEKLIYRREINDLSD